MGFIIGYNGTERNKEAGRLGGLSGGQRIKEYWIEQKLIYLQDPKVCFQCSMPIEYKKKNNKFCSHSCSAQYNNLQRGKCINKNVTKKCSCIGCGDEVIVNIRHALKTVKCFKCKNIKCIHCKGKATHQIKNGNYICNESVAQCPEIKKRNSNGQKLAYALGRRTGSFTDEHRKKSNIKKIEKAKIEAFGINVLRLTKTARKYLFEFRGKKCEECGLEKWQDKELVFEIDHIDGNNKNNTYENLKILCLNCHSQTPTFRGKNVNNFKAKHDNETIYQTYLNLGTINKTLIHLGYAAKGGNYQTVKKIIIEKEYNKRFNTLSGEIQVETRKF